MAIEVGTVNLRVMELLDRGHRKQFGIPSPYTVHTAPIPGKVHSLRIVLYINVREYRRGNQKWVIQRNWQHKVHQMKKNKTKNTTQYVLDTTIRKRTQIT